MAIVASNDVSSGATRDILENLELSPEIFYRLNKTRIGSSMLFDNVQIGFVVIFYLYVVDINVTDRLSLDMYNHRIV